MHKIIFYYAMLVLNNLSNFTEHTMHTTPVLICNTPRKRRLTQKTKLSWIWEIPTSKILFEDPENDKYF